jgi:ribosomal protein S18 acetylase RimI-like enzyme
MRLRPALPDDLDALVALEQATFATDRVPRRQWRHHLASPSARVLVAAERGSLLGAALLFFRRGSRVARLYSIAIAAAARGRGLGRRLLDAGERVAREQGATAIRLEVRQDNRGAIALYESHGYRRIGEKPGYYEDGASAWRYEKRL